MANTTTLNSELFQKLLVQSQFAMYENSIARSVGTVYDYPMGSGKSVSVPVWASITASKPGEGVAPNVANTNTTSVSIDLAEHVYFAQITDMLRDSAQESVINDLATQAGLALGESLDNDLVALFANAGITKSVGAANVAVTASTIMSAAAQVRNAKYSGPLFAVLNPLQAYGLKAALAGSYAAPSNAGNRALDQYAIGMIGGVTILESALVGITNDAATGCVFAPAAFGVAQRGGISMEEQRQASTRSTDLVLTAVAGTGIIRPELAVKIVGAAA